MLKYKIFHLGYGGALYDCYVSDVIQVDMSFDSIEEAAQSLKNWQIIEGLRTDLTYVILPVVKFSN